MLRPRLFLSEKEFQMTIRENYRHLSFLQLYFQGEPFMHPKIYDYIAFATQHRIYTATSTNGQFLTYENCLKIVDSGLHRLVISIDGTTQEVFEKYRVGGSLSLTTDGIKNMVKARKERNKKTPYLIVQFVVFKTNEHQIPEIKKLTRQWGADALKIKSPQLENFENGNALMPSIDKYNRYKKEVLGTYSLKRKKNFKCQRVWNGAVISAQNELLPCCFDKDGLHSFGNLNEKKLNATWHGKTSDQFIKKVWEHDPSIAICKNCTEGLKQTWFRK